jgi:hypothetical protein
VTATKKRPPTSPPASTITDPLHPRKTSAAALTDPGSQQPHVWVSFGAVPDGPTRTAPRASGTCTRPTGSYHFSTWRKVHSMVATVEDELPAWPQVLVGIDDTDIPTRPGTGWLARRLLDKLASEGLGEPVGVTRHQLLIDPRVPCTSHNSSACLALAIPSAISLDDIETCAAAFLCDHAPKGSAPGLAIVPTSLAPHDRDALSAFGTAAKHMVIAQATARQIAPQHRARLSSHGGNGNGVIGALAAVGLHLGGNDGFFVWMPGIRELPAGVCSYQHLISTLPISDARTLTGARPTPDTNIEIGPWTRPVLLGGHAVVLLESVEFPDAPPRWQTAPPEVVKKQ